MISIIKIVLFSLIGGFVISYYGWLGLVALGVIYGGYHFIYNNISTSNDPLNDLFSKPEFIHLKPVVAAYGGQSISLVWAALGKLCVITPDLKPRFIALMNGMGEPGSSDNYKHAFEAAQTDQMKISDIGSVLCILSNEKYNNQKNSPDFAVWITVIIEAIGNVHYRFNPSEVIYFTDLTIRPEAPEELKQGYSNIIDKMKALNSAMECLGVPRNCSLEQAHDKYRELAESYHPDKVGTSSDEVQLLCQNKMAAINDAYDKFKKYATEAKA